MNMRSFMNLFEDSNILDEIYGDIEDLSPDDVGKNEYNGFVLRFEGFSDMCIEDASDRCGLPESDPRHLSSFDDVYKEVQEQWNREEGKEPIDSGFSGTEDNPVQWAIYKS